MVLELSGTGAIVIFSFSTTQAVPRCGGGLAAGRGASSTANLEGTSCREGE